MINVGSTKVYDSFVFVLSGVMKAAVYRNRTDILATRPVAILTSLTSFQITTRPRILSGVTLKSRDSISAKLPVRV
jgi:hypothetical protein